MKQRYALLYILLPLLIIAGCTPVIEPPTPSGEGLNMDQIVVVGSCMAAGMANSEVRQAPGLPSTEIPFGGFYEEGQKYSFANILASSLQTAGAPPFRQPTISADGSGHMNLSTAVAPRCTSEPIQYVFDWKDGNANWVNENPGIGFNNLSVPHLMLRDAFTRTNVYQNAYQAWLLGSPTDSSCYCDFVFRNEPSLSLISLGLEDVLYHAYNGGGNNSPYPMTELDIFETYYQHLLNNLLAKSGSKAVLLNIPDVTQMPFFTAQPLKQYDPQTCEEQAIYIETGTGETRPAKEGDYILMSAQYLLATGSGTVCHPLPNKLVLDNLEAADVRKRTNAYNQILTNISQEFNQPSKRVTLINIHKLYDNVNTGMYVDGVEFTGAHISGGFYSLDGLMPTARGQALIANTIIEALMRAYPNTKLPTVSLAEYPTNRIP